MSDMFEVPGSRLRELRDAEARCSEHERVRREVAEELRRQAGWQPPLLSVWLEGLAARLDPDAGESLPANTAPKEERP